MTEPTDHSKHNSLFNDNMKFLQKAVVIHPDDPHLFLALKRADDDNSRPGDWDLPGGNVNPGELHDQAMIREIHEETGLDVGELHPVQVATSMNHEKNLYVLFIGLSATALTDQVTISHEHTKYLWVTLDEFKQLTNTEFIVTVAELYYS